VRKTCLDKVHELAQKDDRVVFIGSDLGVGTLSAMKTEMPERFFMEGISEAAVIGMASGMAFEGYIPYVNTIATFLTRRCYEQVSIDVALHNLPVRLIGNGGGYVYAPLGPTHQAIEDIAIFRAMPNMTIIAPADADEMSRLMPQTLEWPGPVYIRLAKGYDPVVSSDTRDFTIGKAITMREGDDLLIVTTGVTTRIGMETALLLEKHGIEAAVLHMHTIKPLDTEAIVIHAVGRQAVVTIEEHTIIGGLGSAVAETLLEAGVAPPAFKRFGIPDSFAKKYGSQNELMNHCGLDPKTIADYLTQALGN
jgi:transketolase